MACALDLTTGAVYRKRTVWDQGVRNMPVRRILSTLCLAGFAVATLGATGAAISTNSETVVRDSFSAALNSMPAPRVASTARKAPVVGTEEYWLSADRPAGTLAVAKAVAIGDRIVMSLGGKDIRLEVADVSDYAPQVTAIDTNTGQTRYLMVTARHTGNSTAEPVRFIVEVDQPSTGKIAGKTERAS